MGVRILEYAKRVKNENAVWVPFLTFSLRIFRRRGVHIHF